MKMDEEDVDPENLLGEFTLEDAYDHLKEVEKDLQNSLEELISVASNNEVQTLSSSATTEIVESKQCQFLHSFMHHLNGLNINGEAMHNTIDHYTSTIQELEDEVKKMMLLKITKEEEMINLKNRIKYLKNENDGLQKMREACVGAIEDVANSTYDAEIGTAGRLFAGVKKDLAKLVEIMIADNEAFPDLLADLTSAYMKGGDDAYVDVSPEFDDCVHCLIEADVAMYHRNDKRKIRLVDLI